MTTEEKIVPLMNEVIRIVREECFDEKYQDDATTEECLGIAVSKYFEWDSRIVDSFCEAMTDANFHSLREVVEKEAKKFFNTV